MTAVEDQRTLATQRDRKGSRHRAQSLCGVLEALLAGPFLRLGEVAEQQVDTVAQHLRQPVAKVRDDAGIREAERGAHAAALGEFARRDRRRASGVRGDQVALDVDEFRGRERRCVEVLCRQCRADAEKRVHRALGVGRDHHQALAGHAALASGAHVAVDTGARHVGQVEAPVLVVGYLAAVEGTAAEATRGDHRVRGRSAARAPRGHQVSVQQLEQLILARLVDQRHHALVDAGATEERVIDLDLGVHQRGAHAIDVVLLLHALFRCAPGRMSSGARLSAARRRGSM